MRVIEVSMEQRRNERAGEAGDPRENPPTNGIVRDDSHVRESGDPAGDLTRFAWVGGEWSNRRGHRDPSAFHNLRMLRLGRATRCQERVLVSPVWLPRPLTVDAQLRERSNDSEPPSRWDDEGCSDRRSEIENMSSATLRKSRSLERHFVSAQRKALFIIPRCDAKRCDGTTNQTIVFHIVRDESASDDPDLPRGGIIADDVRPSMQCCCRRSQWRVLELLQASVEQKGKGCNVKKHVVFAERQVARSLADWWVTSLGKFAKILCYMHAAAACRPEPRSQLQSYLELRGQGQEVREQHGRHYHARLVSHRSYPQGVQCFRPNAVLCKLDL
ncbi:hypothetical protein PR048_023144 [Dryococelus australis]|uniref:Uncharacterized protein n=1 Tax=Dryococelus australis TaxID=614101 RepID=A0ABQ9GTC5_9NEOP|nr:hypothetical protein PR048_023144 [Dryococelus australis]